MTIPKERLLELARQAGFVTGKRDLADGIGHIAYAHPLASADCTPELHKLAQLIRNEVLEEVRVLVWKTGSPSGDEFGHGYNKAAAEIERAAEALKEQL